MAKKASDTKENLVVKLVLTPELLEKEPQLKKVYDPKKGEVVLPVPQTMTVEFREEVKGLLEDLKEREIAEFNPLLFKILELHDIRTRKPIKDATFKENEEVFQSANKVVRSFNSSLAGVKKTMKEPYTLINKKIDAIFNLLSQEVKNTDGALAENFKDHLAEKERKKQEAEEKKRKADIEAMEKLQSENAEIAEKNKAQEIDNLFLNISGKINSMVSNITTSVMTSNEDGLSQISETLNARSFEKVKQNVPNFSILPEDKVSELEVLFNTQLDLSKKVVSDRIQFYQLQKQQQENEIRNEVQNQVNPTVPPVNQPPVENVPGPPNDLPFTAQDNEESMRSLDELGRFKLIQEEFRLAKQNFLKSSEKVASIPLDTDYTKSVQKVLVEDSMPKILDFYEKIDGWLDNKIAQFKK